MSTYPAPDFERKILSPAELAAKLDSLPRPLVFTNGCFDILHRGHASYLAQARALGACMVLALNTDASVRRQGKGDDRPINSLENRAAVAAARQRLGGADDVFRLPVAAFDQHVGAELFDQGGGGVVVEPGNVIDALQRGGNGGAVFQ